MLTTLLIILVLIMVMMLVGVRIFSIQPFIVLSGSMEPEFMTGSIIYVKDVDVNDLKVGDAITFNMTEGVATHRIVEIVTDKRGGVAYRTQGDVNERPDGSLVTQENVIGSPIFSIPYLGYFVEFIKRPPGIYIGIAVSAGVMLMALILEIVDDDAKKKRTEEENVL